MMFAKWLAQEVDLTTRVFGDILLPIRNDLVDNNKDFIIPIRGRGESFDEGCTWSDDEHDGFSPVDQ